MHKTYGLRYFSSLFSDAQLNAKALSARILYSYLSQQLHTSKWHKLLILSEHQINWCKIAICIVQLLKYIQRIQRGSVRFIQMMASVYSYIYLYIHFHNFIIFIPCTICIPSERYYITSKLCLAINPMTSKGVQDTSTM